MLKSLLAAAILAAAPLAAAAQPAPGVTAEQISRARAEADALIAAADAEALFDNTTDSDVPTVRHKPSGLVCAFEPGEADNGITIFEQGVGIPRGEDVGCNSTFGGAHHTLYATRYRPAMSAERALSDAVAAIRRRFPDARRYEGSGTSIEVDREGRQPLPPTHSAAFTIELEGVGPAYTSARVAEHDGWIIKQRLTVEMSKVTAGQLMGGMHWTRALESIVDRDRSI